MKEVCVITGGGSGMGLATAKYIKDRLVIIFIGAIGSATIIITGIYTSSHHITFR